MFPGFAIGYISAGVGLCRLPSGSCFAMLSDSGALGRGSCRFLEVTKPTRFGV